MQRRCKFYSQAGDLLDFSYFDGLDAFYRPWFARVMACCLIKYCAHYTFVTRIVTIVTGHAAVICHKTT